MVEIFKDKVSCQKLTELAQAVYVDMVKGVVDVRKNILALGGELHADCEQMLLDQGSKQEDLWGFNVYLGKPSDSRLEYTSMINIRPRQGNLSREVQNPELRQQIKGIIDRMVAVDA